MSAFGVLELCHCRAVTALRRAAVSAMLWMAEVDGDGFMCCSEHVLGLLSGLWVSTQKFWGCYSQFPFVMFSYCFATCPLNVTEWMMFVKFRSMPRVRAVLVASFFFTKREECFDSVNFSFWCCSCVIFSLETIHRTCVSCMLHQSHLPYLLLLSKSGKDVCFMGEEGVENF